MLLERKNSDVSRFMEEFDRALTGVSNELNRRNTVANTNLLYMDISYKYAQDLIKSLKKENEKIDAELNQGGPLTPAQVSYAALMDDLLVRFSIILKMRQME